MIGRRMIDATVCDTNVVKQSTSMQSETVTTQTLPDGSARMIEWLSVSSRPDRCTACET